MWEKAKITDVNNLTEIFWANISAAPEYISHGEMQMGIANASGQLAANGRQLWVQYIKKKITGEGGDAQHPSVVLVYKDNGEIKAFCVLEILQDGDKPFGIICDMLVKPALRGNGLGKMLLIKAKEWFKSMGIKDIYLESGIDNHAAHAFFKKQGFREVSHIFKLME